MSAGANTKVVCGLILASCSSMPSGRNSPADQLELRFEPTNDVIYKIGDDLDQENWDFSLIVRGSTAAIDKLRISHFSRETLLQTIELDVRALAPHRGATGEGEIVWRYLNFRLPAALEIDGLRVEVLARGEVRGRARATLVRFEQSKRFRLPLQGCWFVSSGHDFGVEHRRHYSRGHFAWDFVRVDAQGRPASGGALDEHYSFAQPVFAPGDGIVTGVRSGFEDVPPGHPGKMDEANYVVIDHGDSIRSRMVHLKNGTIRVREGDRVKSGDIIAEVGNSGGSDSPHLHFQFEQEITGKNGLPAQSPLPVMLSGYHVTWNQGTAVPIALGRPRRGQFVCSE